MSGVSYQTVDQNSAGQRLDNFLMKFLKGVPKSKIYQIIRKGEVRINGKRAKPKDKLALDDQVRIPPVRMSQPSDVNAPPGWIKTLLDESVIEENDRWLIINKPAGVAVHGGSGVSLGFIEALRLARPQQYYELAHRLDRATSGILVLGKSKADLAAIHAAMEESTKVYDVLVNGRWPEGITEVTSSIQKVVDGSGESKMVESDDGKISQTTFKIECNYLNYTKLVAVLGTGRTHQIRVHCESQGCPIAGDEKYDKRDNLKKNRKNGLKRMFLHAKSISLPGLGSWEAPLPDQLQHFLESLDK